VLKLLAPRLQLGGILEQFRHRTVLIFGVSAGADLGRLDSQAGVLLYQLIESEIGKCGIENANGNSAPRLGAGGRGAFVRLRGSEGTGSCNGSGENTTGGGEKTSTGGSQGVRIFCHSVPRSATWISGTAHYTHRGKYVDVPGKFPGKKVRSINQSRPHRAALASWVELLSSSAGGGHSYEDVEAIVLPNPRLGNRAKIL